MQTMARPRAFRWLDPLAHGWGPYLMTEHKTGKGSVPKHYLNKVNFINVVELARNLCTVERVAVPSAIRYAVCTV